MWRAAEVVDGGLWLHNNTARKITGHAKEVPFSVAFNESDNDKENGSLLGCRWEWYFGGSQR